MENHISISYEFIDKYVRFTKPEYVQVYLYAIYKAQTDGTFPSASDVAAALDISPAKAEFIFEFWASRGELIYTDKGYKTPDSNMPKETVATTKTQKTRRILSSKPSYSQKEISAVSAQNKNISGLFYQAETILGKVLTASEMEMLFSFNDWLGLPVEVIMMLLSYAAKRGKTTKRYLETVAIDWADKGIDTYEAAEALVTELEEYDKSERAVRSILGIYDRGLTTTERKYIKLWTYDLKIPTELISHAYDKTVAYTGKLSWSYMDKLLQSWLANGYTTIDEVAAADEEFYKNNIKDTSSFKTTKRSKFNNYDDDNKDDYKELEEHILDMMLDGTI